MTSDQLALLALTVVGLVLVGWGFAMGVVYARRYPPPVHEPAPALTLPVRRKTTLRLVQRPFDQDRCARAPFSVVPSEDAR